MWKPALFLLTVVLVTPIGRAALGHYARLAVSTFALQSTDGELAIAALVLVFVGIFLLVLCQSPKNPNAQWIVRRVQDPEPARPSPNRTPLNADRHPTGIAVWLAWFRHLNERLRRL
jgi:hypothetical protein